MVEHTLWTVHESLIQGYCTTADCATGDCARLCKERYYCTTGKEKNTTSYARNTIGHFSRFESTHKSTWILQVPDLQVQVTLQVDSYRSQSRVQFSSNLQVQIQVTCRSTYVQLYFDALMVVADHDTTKGVILSPCTKTIDTMETATPYYEGIFR